MAASLTRRRALSGLRVVSDQQIFLKQSLRTTELCRALRTGVLRHSILHRVTHSASFWTRSVAALTPLDRRHFATLPEKDALAVDPKLLLKYFQVVAKELKDVEKELLRRSLDAKKTKELNDKVARLSGIVRLFEKVNQLRKEVDGLKDLEKDFAKTGDDEMLTMALEDLKKCETEINHIYDQSLNSQELVSTCLLAPLLWQLIHRNIVLEPHPRRQLVTIAQAYSCWHAPMTRTETFTLMQQTILEQIVPPDPVDSSEVLLELTAGVGGQEAMLFTRDIMEMYMHYCRWKGWSCTPLDYETADQGGVRHASLNIGGRDVGKFLKFESGVHRVQRVPATEKSGRIHTSTMAVAVMPMPSEVEVVISPKDLVVKTKRASGPGGQHVNKTESAVQMQHIPTGIMVESSQERSQLTNRELALKILRAKLYQMELDKQLSQHSAQRKLQVGSRGRSEKIRTYNYAQDRVTDHRIPITVHNIEEFLQGEQQLDNVIQRLLQESRKEIVLEVLQPVVK